MKQFEKNLLSSKKNLCAAGSMPQAYSILSQSYLRLGPSFFVTLQFERAWIKEFKAPVRRFTLITKLFLYRFIRQFLIEVAAKKATAIVNIMCMSDSLSQHERKNPCI